jgi:hypothetical protein
MPLNQRTVLPALYFQCYKATYFAAGDIKMLETIKKKKRGR